LEFEVVDVTGNSITDGILTEGLGEINTSKLPAGIYWINLKQKGKIIATGKFAKIEQ
jgi:hypothetical protein